VPFAKRKTGRGPLQRLSDQRRSLALAGLAAGAVVSAAVLRRKRRGAEAEFGTPETAPSTATATPGTTPATATSSSPSSSEVAATAAAATATQTDQEAPETAAAAAANGTDHDAPDADTALNAAVEPATPADEPEPEPEKKATTLSEPTTGELNAEEASILAVLAQAGRSDEDRTVIAVATSLERESADVANVLRKLSAEGVVSGELYTATGDKIWAVTERGVRRLGAQH
jgi:hypothetical protein